MNHTTGNRFPLKRKVVTFACISIVVLFTLNKEWIRVRSIDLEEYKFHINYQLQFLGITVYETKRESHETLLSTRIQQSSDTGSKNRNVAGSFVIISTWPETGAADFKRNSSLLVNFANSPLWASDLPVKKHVEFANKIKHAYRVDDVDAATKLLRVANPTE